MSQPQNPAQRVFAAFAAPGKSGPAVVADLLGLDLTTVYRWDYPVGKRGTGGLIPAKHQGPLLTLAEMFGYNLTAEDLIQR